MRIPTVRRIRFGMPEFERSGVQIYEHFQILQNFCATLRYFPENIYLYHTLNHFLARS